MRRGLALLLSCAALLGGCASIEAPYSVPAYEGTYTVREAVEQRASLDGERINVIGLLETCQPLSCGLSEGEYWLSLGSSPDFDERASRFEGKEVVIAATFHDTCVSDPASGMIAACSDRPDTLSEPTLIGLARFFRS